MERKIDKIIDVAHDTKDFAKNIIEPSSKNIGNTLGIFTDFFNNVVLYPLKCLNIEFKEKAQAFQKKVEKKYNQIPESNRVEPDVKILGPTLESLKYNIDEEYMKELFANLLCSGMDNRKKNLVHPKYVQTISNMDEIDANVFHKLVQIYGKKYIKAGQVQIAPSNTRQYYTSALPQWLIDIDIEHYSIFEISRSLIRLANLGLIDLMYDRTAGESILNNLYNKQEVQKIFNEYKKINPTVILTGTNCIININDDGHCFADMVFNNGNII